MQYHKLSSLLLAVLALPGAANADYVLNEPENSAMAHGHWVKIRVTDNGIYGFSHDRLRALGFDDPTAVHVFGYDPTLMLDHNFEATPSDMNLLQSVNENGQLAFYAVGNVDYQSEIWPVTPIKTDAANTINRRVHSYSKGGTYFLSDIAVDELAINPIEAPESIEDTKVYTAHDALIYHEEDAFNPGMGSVWFCGPGIKSDGCETHHLSVSKATGDARLVCLGLMSSNASQSNNYFTTEYTGGIRASSRMGYNAKKIINYATFTSYLFTQTLQFPEEMPEVFDFDLTFKPSPTAGPFNQDSGIDYFGLVYNRRNDLGGESNMLMYFNNTDSVAAASLTGFENGAPWHLWNVTYMNDVKEHRLLRSNDGMFAYLPVAEAGRPNAIAAFRTDVAQPEPEVIGTVSNQNLHAISVPDLVIVAARPMMEAAELAADFHRELQGMDVAVVDQQQIFNEYGSGNIAPEALRRFFAHLYQREPGKFKGILIIGDGTYHNPTAIGDESSTVVTAQMEWYDKANNETVNSCTDAFFGSFNKRAGSNPYYQIISAGMTVPVGRLPFNNIYDVCAYYNKARHYAFDNHSYPAAGNIILASDYATRNEQSHMANGEGVLNAIPEETRSLLTVTRAASNLYSSANNNINRKTMMSALERGAGFYAFFGHGTATAIGGMTGDDLTHISTVNSQNHPNRYPFMFIGSCHVGAFDQYRSNLATSFAANEFGGGIAVVAASRKVFQDKNQRFGERVSQSYYALNAGDWLGKAWLNAVNAHLQASPVDQILNTCSYNFIGDPAIPSFAPTHSIVFDDFESIAAGGENILSGNVVIDDGVIDATFSGEILISVYDSPQVLKNVAPAVTSGADGTTINECEIDQQLIGEYIGSVVNGHFSVPFRGPNSGRPGNHRIQAYAYSADDASRALGVIASVPMVDSDTPGYTVTDALPEIRDFKAGDGAADECYSGNVEITARIYAPAGIADANAVLNPVRLAIDGVTKTNIRRLLSYTGNNMYEMTYSVSGAADGRHTASLQVIDANGNIADNTIEFTINNAPQAGLSAAVSDEGTRFEVTCRNSSDIDEVTLIVENLFGDTVKTFKAENISEPFNVNSLSNGAYRAYAQLKGAKFVTATPKVNIIIP